MKDKKIAAIIIAVACIIVLSGVILLIRNHAFSKNKIEIIDASYMCAQSLEKFYEDDNNTYFFPCVKSGSVFVKLPDGKKMLVVRALDEELVTIDELLDAGLDVYTVAK